MTHLVIKNIGPIESAEFDLKKVNVIIGPQSSGKSTIEKIACYCTWVEKRASQDCSFDFFLKEYNFINELVRFHKLDGYLKPNSSISYQSDVLKINYEHQKGAPELEWVDKYSFINSKIAYIPSERNIVAAVPNWFDVKLSDNNILSYLQDWGESRQIHTKETPLKVLDLGASYYSEGISDNVVIENNGILQLTNTSSGYQSIIPLSVLVYYFTNYVINNDILPESPKKKEQLRRTSRRLLSEILLGIESHSDELSTEDNIISDLISKFQLLQEIRQTPNEDLTEELINLRNSNSKFISVADNFTKYQFANLFIEEPEQNLFPETQKELVYHLLKSILNNENHRLFLTTHSPYILYSLNNCMLGGLLSSKGKLPDDVLGKINCRDSFIAPENVSVYEIRDKKLHLIQGDDGLISDNYFESKMKELMDDFYLMLNFYD